MKKFEQYLWLSQLSLFAFLLWCSLLLPSVAITNGGISNFGNDRLTVLPYVLGFLLSVGFLSLAARRLVRLHSRFLKMALGLLLLALLNVLILLSTFPRHLSLAYSDIHDYLGIALFVYEFGLSVWFVRSQKSYQAGGLLVLELAGSIIGLLSILKIIHFLFIGQIIGAAGFGLLLPTCLPRIVASGLSRAEKL